MIDINELRQLAQAATPGPWKTGQYLGSLRQFVINMDVGDKGRGSDVAFTSSAFGSDETVANARLIAAANPAAITELLDRLEAAEKERDELRAKIAGLVPIGLLHVGDYYGEELQDWEFEADQQACDRLNEAHFQREASLKLYALPGAKTVLRVPDAVTAALDTLDDYIARIEGNDRGACNHINLLRRYLLDATDVGENK